MDGCSALSNGSPRFPRLVLQRRIHEVKKQSQTLAAFSFLAFFWIDLIFLSFSYTRFLHFPTRPLNINIGLAHQ